MLKEALEKARTKQIGNSRTAHRFSIGQNRIVVIFSNGFVLTNKDLKILKDLIKDAINRDDSRVEGESLTVGSNGMQYVLRFVESTKLVYKLKMMEIKKI